MNIAIIGLGLIGGSAAIELKNAGFATRIVGVDTNPEHVDKAFDLGLIDSSATMEEACSCVDIVIIAIPVDKTVEVLPTILDCISSHVTVVDMGSTKRMITKAVNDHPKRRNFVAAHPMAGTENSGPGAAIPGLFRDKIVILCDQEDSGPQHLALIEKMFHTMGMKIAYMSSDEQDHTTAFISHLPHAAAFALANAILAKEDREIIFDLASGGFQSTVRLAKSSPEMWGPIFQQNKEYVIEALDFYIKHLKEFRKSIESDEIQMNIQMANANRIRGILEGIDGNSLIQSEQKNIKLYKR